MDGGVFSSSNRGRAVNGPMTIMIREVTAVRVMQFPITSERFSLSLAPKNWETIMPAPTAMPTKRTNRRLRMGPALPTAARALSPI